MAYSVLADNNSSAPFFDKLNDMEFKVEKATKALLQDNEKYILCLETPEISLMFVLLANTLKKLKVKFPNQYSDLVFTDFHNFLKQQNEDFPDILVCEMGVDEQLNEYSEVLTSWARLVKEKSKMIIFIMKNSKYLEQYLTQTRLVHVLEIKFTEFWKEHETFDEKDKNGQAGLNKQINNEVKTVNVNKAKEESSESSSSHDAVKMIQALKILKLHGIDKSINDVDADGNTQLHLAASKGQNKIVKALLDYDVPDKDLRNKNGLTPLHLATSGGHCAVVSILLENNANVNATDNIYGETALHKACYIKDIRLIKLLLQFGAEIETKSKNGNIALHFASSHGHTAAVTRLLEQGSNIHAQNKYGQSPLHFAVKFNKKEVVLELLRKGANIHLKDNHQQSALDYAELEKRYSNLVQIMAKHVAKEKKQ